MNETNVSDWVLVPRKPTPAMLFGATGLVSDNHAAASVHARYAEVWADLIEAAPEPALPDDGGPAFPLEYRHWEYRDSQFKGMSLRDWFAGQALANEALGRAYHLKPELLADYAYQYADAMIAARAAHARATEQEAG